MPGIDLSENSDLDGTYPRALPWDMAKCPAIVPAAPIQSNRRHHDVGGAAGEEVLDVLHRAEKTVADDLWRLPGVVR